MMRANVVGWARGASAAVVAGLLLAALPAAPARAVEPGAGYSQPPDALGLRFEDVTFPAGDSVAVTGWWFPGPKNAAAVVIASRGSGTMADMLPAAKELLARGFHVLTFDYRGFGPGFDATARDTLRYVVFSSRWVEDMLGALRYARARGGRQVFAWGQDLGSAVALASAARDRGTCDAVAIEGVFRTSQEAIRANGTSTIGDTEARHRRLVRGVDEPFSAAARLRVPVLGVLAGKDDVTPASVTQSVLMRARVGRELWRLPEAAHADAERTPGYFDRLAAWFKKWTPGTPPARRP